MIKRILPILFICNFAFAQSTITIGTTTVTVDTVASGLDIPWEITWGPDNHIWTTERKGIVSRINPVTKTKTQILDITSLVYQQSESGLLGLALHPDFTNTPEVFLVYTFGTFSNIRERLVKYTYNGSNLVSPVILIDSIIGNTTHDGARLIFLPDTTLLMTTGDAQNTSLPQNLNSLSGKVLRLNTDGSIPVDNPIANSYVYSFGHRNAQGMMLHPNGKVYISEHGASTDDEFQILYAGRNYGWPNVEGFCDTPGEQTFCTANNVVEPLAAWTPTIAPSDMVYYSNAAFPEFDNAILMTVLKDKKVIALKLNTAGDSVVSQTHYLTNTFQRLRDICIGNNKEIYLATNGASWSNTNPNTHLIIRLTPPVPPSGLNEIQNNSIKIYPNPFNDFITIESIDTLDLFIQINDLSGRNCLNKRINSNLQRIDVSSLVKGIYIVSLNDSAGNILLTQKLIK
jgi:glucose/arabinose dehydrogenase